MKNIFIFGGLVIVLLFVGAWVSKSKQSNDPNIISEKGLHWHPELEIFVKGMKLELPANIGIGAQYASLPTYDQKMRMTAIHTHDDMPIVHLEFGGKVTKEDIKLGNLFKIWGKSFTEFGKVKMTVNETENSEFENYEMKDGDKIKIYYE